MVLNDLINNIKNYCYPDDITLTHALEAGPAEHGCLCFLAGYTYLDSSFSLYLYRNDGKLMFYFFLDNDESDHPEYFLILPGTMANYQTAFDWIRAAAGRDNRRQTDKRDQE